MICHRRHVLLALLCAPLTGTFGGARLFPSGDDAVEYNAKKLPPIQTASNAVELEIMFVERPVDDPLFGFEPQVTGRTAPSYFAAAYGDDLFGDGRARATSPPLGEIAQ